MDKEGKHVNQKGLWGHCNSMCPNDLGKNTLVHTQIFLSMINYSKLKNIQRNICIFFIPNLDGVVPETNNATKLPSKGNEEIE